VATAVQFYFAWVDPGTAYNPVTHAIVDEYLLGAALSQQEGEFAALTVVMRNPTNESGNALGLLGPGRKRHAWLSWDIGGGPVPLFFGTLVGIPTDVFGAKVTLEFSGKPDDYDAQKLALAETLKVLPWYDEAFFDEQRRGDPNLVLEAYAALWHVDPVTHAVTTSDYLTGEDGLETFNITDLIARAMKLELKAAPATSVIVDAVMKWTQRAAGQVDLTEHMIDNWPSEGEAGVITSFTMAPDDWPKVGAGLGEGWTVARSTAHPQHDLAIKHRTGGSKTTVIWWDGAATNLETSESDDYLIVPPPGSIPLPQVVTAHSSSASYQEDADGHQTLASWSASTDFSDGLIPLSHLTPTLGAAYDAARGLGERVTFTLHADVQPVVTAAEEPIRLDNLSTVDLSLPAGDETDAEAPIGDPRRRSYVATPRGRQSLEYLILLARAHLLRRARAIEITFGPTELARFADISLRKSARVYDPRLPGGTAFGKIIGYQLAIMPTKASVSVDFNVTIGCALGQDGSIEAVGGDPEYVEEDYIGPAEDWQQYSGQVLLVENDDVGYTPVPFDPADDGLDFIAGITAEEAIEIPLAVVNPSATQRAILLEQGAGWLNSMPSLPDDEAQQYLSDRTLALNTLLQDNATVASFKLKSMTAAYETPVPVTVTDLKIPKMLDLAAT